MSDVLIVKNPTVIWSLATVDIEKLFLKTPLSLVKLIILHRISLKCLVSKPIHGKRNWMWKRKYQIIGVAEWYTASCLSHRWSWVRATVQLKPPQMLVHKSVSMWIKKAWLPCWSLYSQQVSHQRWIWGSHTWESTQKGSTLALKHMADITRSPRQGYQWPHEKNLCPPEITKKNNK